jgi:hypothetical protein
MMQPPNLSNKRTVCVWQQFNRPHVWIIPEECVTTSVGRYPGNGQGSNVLPTWCDSPTLHSAGERERERESIHESYPNFWLGRGGPLAWPPRSPDLTPLDYGLWGHIKALVYETKVDSRAALRRIFAVAEHLFNHAESIASAIQSIHTCWKMRSNQMRALGAITVKQVFQYWQVLYQNTQAVS